MRLFNDSGHVDMRVRVHVESGCDRIRFGTDAVVYLDDSYGTRLSLTLGEMTDLGNALLAAAANLPLVAVCEHGHTHDISASRLTA